MVFRPGGFNVDFSHSLRLQPEPIENMGTQSDEVRLRANGRELSVAELLNRRHPLERTEVQLGVLRQTRQVRHHQEHFILVSADEGQYLAVIRVKEFQRAAAKGLEPLPLGDQALQPPQVGARILQPRLHVDNFIVVLGVRDNGQIEALGVGAGKPRVAVRTPLHGRTDAVAVAQEDIIPHPDLVPVVDDWRPRQREEQAVHELDLIPVHPQQRMETTPDAHIDARLGVVGVDPVDVVALLVGNHLQGELIVIAQEQGPLAILRNGGRLSEDIDNGEPVFHADGHEHARHEREMERHVALVAVPKIRRGVLGPLVGLGQEHAASKIGVNFTPYILEQPVRFRQVLTMRAFALVKIRHGVQPQPIHTHAQPEIHHLDDCLADQAVIVIQVRLVMVEAVPVISIGHGVPRPVRALEVLEDDARLLVLLRRVAPDVEVAPMVARGGPARALEPGMLVRGMVQDQLRDHAQAPAVRFSQEHLEIA